MTQDPRSVGPASTTADPATATLPGPAHGPSYGPPGTAPAGYPDPVQAAGPGVRVFSAGVALSYGWRKFRENMPAWLGVSSIGFGIYAVAFIFARIIAPDSALQVVLLLSAYAGALWLLQAFMIRGALYEIDGARPQFASFFRFVHPGRVLLAAVLVFFAFYVGALFFVLPGIAVLYACIFVLQFAIDANLDPIAAVIASARLAFSSLQVAALAVAVLLLTAIWPVLMFAAILLAGNFGLIFILGYAVTGPVCLIATTYAYRVLTGGPVAN